MAGQWLAARCVPILSIYAISRNLVRLIVESVFADSADIFHFRIILVTEKLHMLFSKMWSYTKDCYRFLLTLVCVLVSSFYLLIILTSIKYSLFKCPDGIPSIAQVGNKCQDKAMARSTTCVINFYSVF